MPAPDRDLLAAAIRRNAEPRAPRGGRGWTSDQWQGYAEQQADAIIAAWREPVRLGDPGVGPFGWCGDPAPHESHPDGRDIDCPGVDSVRPARRLAPMSALEQRARDGDR